jgi:hypothetical protein
MAIYAKDAGPPIWIACDLKVLPYAFYLGAGFYESLYERS